jgi:hypothetical protein
MKIIIKENQVKLLNEAMGSSFSFEELSSKMRPYEMYAYCIEHLGRPIGQGSSRCVFQLTDNHVLKLAFCDFNKCVRNGAGEAQNKVEYERFLKFNSPLLPRVIYCDRNYHYIVCEQLLPAKNEDFEKILGIPFFNYWTHNSIKEPHDYRNGDKTIGFNKYFDDNIEHNEPFHGFCFYDIVDYMSYKYVDKDEGYDDERYNKFIENSEWFSELLRLIKEANLCDFASKANYGLVNRDGKPTLVLSDAGLSLDVWSDYYRA